MGCRDAKNNSAGSRSCPPGVAPAATDSSGKVRSHFGCDVDGAAWFIGCLILMRHWSRLENGPDERWPSSSTAYQPGLMPRNSDLSSLMKCGVAIAVLRRCRQVRRSHGSARRGRSCRSMGIPGCATVVVPSGDSDRVVGRSGAEIFRWSHAEIFRRSHIEHVAPIGDTYEDTMEISYELRLMTASETGSIISCIERKKSWRCQPTLRPAPEPDATCVRRAR